MDPNRALTPVDGQAGYRTRLGQRFIATHYREGVTKLAGINYALVLPAGNWSVRFHADCEDSRIRLYEDSTLTNNGTEIKLINTFRRFELDANSGGAGRTDARFFVDPVVSDPGDVLTDVNIPAHQSAGLADPSKEPFILYEKIYVIQIIPRPQLMTVGILIEIWQEDKI